MKMLLGFFALAMLLVSCGKEESKPAATEVKKTTVAPPPVEKKPLPEAPQGKLPKMDPEKARFIAVPNTPPDKAGPEVKKAEAK
ncbi:MAG: hypothetical protein ACO1TE_14885 [Prosthecobacter sp.]